MKSSRSDFHVKGGQKASYPADVIRNILVECKASRIHMLGHSGDDIQIYWQDTRLRKLNILCEGDTLRIKEKDVAAIYELFGLLELSREKDLFIELPQTFSGNIRLDSTEECTEVGGIQTTGTLSIYTKTGDVILNDTTTNSIQINTEHGKIKTDGLFVSTGIILYSSSGKISCSIRDAPENYSISCHSQHGVSSIPRLRTSGSKTLQAHSLTGNIFVQFSATA